MDVTLFWVSVCLSGVDVGPAARPPVLRSTDGPGRCDEGHGTRFSVG